ncbi:MAG: hypothetical protein ACXVHC_02650, partial [Frankiaceae bacterium]
SPIGEPPAPYRSGTIARWTEFFSLVVGMNVSFVRAYTDPRTLPPSVEQAYPELVVFEERPDWIDDDEYARIKARSGFRFDQPDDYWSQFYRS